MYPKVEKLMKQRGINIVMLSKATGIPPTTIYDWKRRSLMEKKPVYLAADNLQKIAKCLGVSMDELMPDEEEA